MKKIFSLILLCLFVCFLGACTSETTTNDGYKGSITIALPIGNNNKDVFDKAISDYNKLRPNVSVKIVYQSGDDYYESYLDSINKKNNPADCAFIDHIYIQYLASRNKIISVTNDIEDVKDSYVENLVDLGKYNNDYYSYPFSANTICLYYNKEILGDRNVPETYDDFLEVAVSIYQEEQTKGADKAQVFSLFTGYDSKSFGSFLFNSWLKREGGSISSSDLTTALMDSIEVKNVLTKWNEIATYGYGNATDSTESLFYSGRVAFIEMGCWKIPQLFEGLNAGKYGVAPLFSLNESGNNSSVIGMYSLCVTKQTDENKMKLASDFCKFLSTNTEVQLAYAKHTNLLPVTTEACSDEYYSTPEWQMFINAMPNAATRLASPAWPKIQTGIENMIIGYMSGSVSLNDAVSTAQNYIQNALAQYSQNR